MTAGETFGQMLRRLRQERRLSQRQAAQRSFLSQSYFVHVEMGRTQRFSRDVVSSIAAGFNLSGVETARLLIAAGYFPWRMSDAAITAFVEAVEDASSMGHEEPTFIRRRTG